MSVLRYPARITVDDEGRYQVRFLDIPAAMTEGTDMDDARAMGQDVLDSMLTLMVEDCDTIPRPSEQSGPDVHWFTPSPEVAIPIQVHWAREDADMTLQELAARIGKPYQSVQRLERTVGNPTLKTVQKVFKALGRKLELAMG